jgi:hypothetical protein
VLARHITASYYRATPRRVRDVAHRLNERSRRPGLMNRPAPLYSRELPGGGYVIIEELPAEGGVFRAQLTVERRTDPVRRDGHERPVIATAEGPSADDVYHDLLQIASDNVAVARCILRWQARQ